MQIHKNKGYALIVAAFFVLVLSLISIVTAKVNIEQNDAVYFEMLNNKTYYAARAGLDWGTYQIVVQESGNSCMSTNPKNDLPVTSFNQDGLRLIIDCTQNSATEKIYTINATATHGEWGDRDYMWRKLTRTLHAA